MDIYYKNFCQNIRHLRQVHNLTQRQMAQLLGISVNTLGRMERCEAAVRIHSGILCRVCDCFDVSSDALLRENWPEMLKKSRNE